MMLQKNKPAIAGANQTGVPLIFKIQAETAENIQRNE